MKLEKLKKHLSDYLKSKRCDLNLSQVQLAKKAKVSQATIAQIETGRKLPSLETLIRILNALGIEEFDLCPGEFA